MSLESLLPDSDLTQTIQALYVLVCIYFIFCVNYKVVTDLGVPLNLLPYLVLVCQLKFICNQPLHLGLIILPSSAVL